MLKNIVVKGAKEHNLKNISVEIPRDKLVIITGLSGSGKSSLAFDTIYAEGQRRYVESLSAYARQFLDKMKKPNVDLIEGLSPAISIEQKTTSKNPRSIVATVTEIYDYMRVLFARVGVPYSPFTGKEIKSQTVSEIVDKILDLPKPSRITLFSPIVRGRKGEYKKEFAGLKKQGFEKLRINDEVYEIDDAPTLNKKLKHNIDVLVDKFLNKKEEIKRISESVEVALKLSDGLIYIDYKNENLPKEHQKIEKLTFSSKFACPESGFTIEEIEPRLFSFNSPFGACTECDGLGVDLFVDPKLVVPNEKISLADGCIKPWSNSTSLYYAQTLSSIAKHYKFSLSDPWNKLPKKIQEIILYGSDDEEIKFSYDDGYGKYSNSKTFEGVITNLERKYLETESDWKREEISQYQSEKECAGCNGHRLKEEALCIKINKMNISEVTKLSIKEANKWFIDLPKILDNKQNEIAEHVLKEINERLKFLVNVGLDYLNLSRSSGTLSGGESQRIRLASQIGSGLQGVLYVLDEPSIGLHQRDNDRLLTTLKNLRDQGNTVIVVEHDEDAIREADYVFDIGPGAGVHGGQVIAHGTPKQIEKNKGSITGQYLSGAREITVPATRRDGNGKALRVVGATGNNLKNVSVDFPLGKFVCVSGVSGGGKSTLTIETLFKTASMRLNGARQTPAPCETIKGLEHLDKVIDIDQRPIGRTPRSNPATYTGAFTPIRDWFAGLPEAKARGYKPGRFSFNVKGGRCEACQGDGVIKIEMHFLPDVYVECDVCKGQRYNRETLEVTWRGKSIADVLDMTVEDAQGFFQAVPSIREKMDALMRVGLGYIKVGQQATTLSGGEAQRVKLSKELSKRATGRTLYILDEPTTWLHFEDVRKLLEVLHELVEQGNSVVVIEHNLDVIKTADWIIDIGPEGGDGGGEIVADGTPEDVAAEERSHTGAYLRDILAAKGRM